MLQKRLMRTEKIGIAISIICAIHCLVVPAALIYLGQHSVNEHAHGIFDITILVLASIFMAITFKQSFGKSYYLQVLLLFILGAILFFASFFVPTPLNHYLFVGGSIFWLIAHVINFKNHRGLTKNV